MKVLIVHDRAEAAAEIKAVVEDDCGAMDQCEVVADYQSARECLSNHIYELLIVDLTIPVRKGVGSPSFDNIHALLNELFTTDNLHVPGDIIGITKDIDALKLVDNKLGPHLMIAIPEDSVGEWKKYLREKLAYARNAARTRSIAINAHHDYDALIITAMDVELAPYEEMFDFYDIKHFRDAREFLFNDRNGTLRRGVAFSIGRSGQPSAASMAQALISFFRPRVAIMSGYCGGVKGKVELGDLIFFEAAYAWDYGKWEEEGDPPVSVFRARPAPIAIVDDPLHIAARAFRRPGFPNREDIRSRVEEISDKKMSKFAIHLKPAASGSAVVAADDIIGRIRGLNDAAWAIDMESYGFYHAARNTRVAKPDFICVKAVSDFANGEKGDELHECCSFLSAKFVDLLLTEHWDFNERRWMPAN